tara:strand:- start:64 stop:414 length:351 start_codon:yes stop_codon:yes gene_type:complete
LFPQALSGGVIRIKVENAVLLMNREACVIIDVRDEKKFNVGHIPNAINISLLNLPESIDRLKRESKKTILVYCGSGNSSGRAMRILSQKGFKSVMSIEGGFSEWIKLQLPVSEKNV